jgi:hypothetical protein
MKEHSKRPQTLDRGLSHIIAAGRLGCRVFSDSHFLK